jgi:aspartate kinase
VTVAALAGEQSHVRPIVYKFGGTSVGSDERMRGVVELVRRAGRVPVVVVSAMSGVTNQLVDAAERIAQGGAPDPDVTASLRRRHLDALERLCDDRAERARVAEEIDGVLGRLVPRPAGARGAAELLDSVASIGEDLSARLLACALRASGQDACVVDARDVVRTDAQFGRARPLDDEIRCLAQERLLPLLERGCVPVVQGFVGATADGRTTTLGRGGSDFTAVLLGAALDAEVVDIWTDVDGILSGDPRAVDRPRVLTEVGFEEAVELAYFGAKVIHPGAAKHAVSRGVHVRIRNSFAPERPGTSILNDRRGARGIAAVAYKPHVTLIKVRSHPTALQYGFLARVFEVLGRFRVPVDLVATSHSSTAFTIDEREEIEEVAAELRAFSDVEILHDLATITVVGQGLMEEPGTDALVFWAVERTPVHLISQASDVSLSFLVSEADATGLVRKLHMTLIELRDAETRELVE